MSNILIIKHGSLGDIAQISGILKDIRENHHGHKIFILTTLPYVELMNKCPYVDEVLLDQRLPRWNIFYLVKLKKILNKYAFKKVYDLQNSTRTSFYRKFLLNISNWSSSETTLQKGQNKKEFNKSSVLERFKFQLDNSEIKTKYTLQPDFSWACLDVDKTLKKYLSKNFILLFPFCSPQLSHKKWPHFNELIKIIKEKHNKIEIAVAPGPLELDEASKINAITIKNENKSVNIMQLTSLIKKASYVISNDTGPAHIAAHLGKKGIVLFGHHTTAKKVSIETKNFKAIEVSNLNFLKPEEVYSKIKLELELIN